MSPLVRLCPCVFRCERLPKIKNLWHEKLQGLLPRSFNCKAIRSPPVISNSKANHNKHNHRRAIKSLSTPQASFPACLRVGCAVARARPEGIA